MAAITAPRRHGEAYQTTTAPLAVSMGASPILSRRMVVAQHDTHPQGRVSLVWEPETDMATAGFCLYCVQMAPPVTAMVRKFADASDATLAWADVMTGAAMAAIEACNYANSPTR